VTIIDRLLAKQPADRFQSAAEVADLLGQHLAQLQDPGRTGGASPLRIEAPQGTNVPRSPGRRWPLLATAAAILLLVGVSLTEATGVTQFAPTLMRIVTGEGTLLVEVNDPAVKVTVEGDGGLVITGAGLHEVHLKPGRYQLRADKDGQRVPLDQELVTITRSGKEVVRVRLEATPAVAAADPSLTPTAEGFTPLFNGKDLTGWAAAEGGTGMWKIEDGALTCTGPRDHLLTTRNDFGDFHLRAEVKINANGNSGIYFRTSKPLVLIGDYEAQITDNPGQGHKTGSLYGLVRVSESPVPPNTWFTYEIIAVGKRIRILVNGKETANFTEDRAGRNTQGHIALQHHDPESRVFFRKVEVKELPADNTTANGAFVLLGAKGAFERKFATLADAVQGASDGDTIEIHGNGPFVSEPIIIRKNALTIRAGTGFRPIIRLSGESETGWGLLLTEGPLILEGLELQRETRDSHSPNGEAWRAIVYSNNAPLYAANCRFLMKGLHTCIVAHSPIIELRNCEFLCAGDSNAFGGDCTTGQRWGIENCVLAKGGCNFGYTTADLKKVSVRVVNNTISGGFCPNLFPAASALVTGPEPPVRVEASGNVFDTLGSHMNFDQSQPKPLPAAEAEVALRRLLAWQGRGNLYGSDQSFLTLTVQWKALELKTPIKSLADWKRFWGGAEVDSLEGQVRYHGGDLRSKLAASPEKLTPEEFRLRPDSAGYRAGKDGQDLGADVDLVGPGPAYERWKKTPGYQQWLKETKQVTKAEASTAEPKAFVVLTGKGVEVRRYDTLAEAVRGASDGDTIEIRGNGPFVTEPIDLKNQSLIIRAADGFRPVLKQTAEAVEKCLPLLETSAPLVLEGLELQQVSQTNRAGGLRSMLISRDAPLWLANCRLFMKDQQQICVSARYCPTVELHNCEFFTNGHGLLWLVDKASKCLVSNCVQAGGNTFGVVSDRPGAREALVRLERNTLATSSWLVHLSVGGGSSPKHWGLAPEDKLVRIKAADNILDANSALTFAQWPETPSQEQWSAIKGQEAETEFQKMIQWDDGRNVFTPGASSISWLISGGFDAPHGPKSLSSWKKFWGNLNADALEGQMRYQGGNLSALLAAGPDKLTAEHFRLRPDSAGYRAGKDGKDLGADIDLVGPGPAYERWKMTPEYQQWLKDTKQVTKTESATPETEFAARELAKWQGEWENADYGRLVIDGERWSSHPKNGFEVVSTIKIVEVTDEMTHILLLSAGVDGKVRTIQTILRVDGDTLHNCGTFGSVRPTEFANKPGCIYTQWKRVSNPPP
jgi:hypothetical protein